MPQPSIAGSTNTIGADTVDSIRHGVILPALGAHQTLKV
jgi:hypothetical protein